MFSTLHSEGGDGASAFPKLNRGLAGMDAAHAGCSQMSLHHFLHMEQNYWNHVVDTLAFSQVLFPILTCGYWRYLPSKSY